VNGPEVLRQSAFQPRGRCNDFEDHIDGHMHSQVSEAADDEYRYEIASFRGRVTQCLNVVRPAHSRGAAATG